jgi:hypothetical protein
LHALTTLNDVTYVEAARTLAQRIILADNDDEARINRAFRACTSRYPSAKENAVLNSSLARLRQTYSSDESSARKLITAGESKPEPSLAPAELAAWTSLASLLLNLDETLTKE